MNALYTIAKEQFLAGQLGWDVNKSVIRAVLVDMTVYTFQPSHRNFADIPIPARVAISPPLTSLRVTGGVATCDDITWLIVTGPICGALILYKEFVSDVTSPLILFLDTITGIPITPTGTSETISFPNGVFAI